MRFCDRCRRCGGIASHADFCEHANDTRFDAIDLPAREPDALPRRVVEPVPRCGCGKALDVHAGWRVTPEGEVPICLDCLLNWERLAYGGLVSRGATKGLKGRTAGATTPGPVGKTFHDPSGGPYQ
jgi:hypothetical protein